MFLTRVSKIVGSYTLHDAGVSVMHIAENRVLTLCGRYTPGNQLNEEELLSQLGGMTLKDYIKMLCVNPYTEHNICRHCLLRYKKDTIYL